MTWLFDPSICPWPPPHADTFLLWNCWTVGWKCIYGVKAQVLLVPFTTSCICCYRSAEEEEDGKPDVCLLPHFSPLFLLYPPPLPVNPAIGWLHSDGLSLHRLGVVILLQLQCFVGGSRMLRMVGKCWYSRILSAVNYGHISDKNWHGRL